MLTYETAPSFCINSTRASLADFTAEILHPRIKPMIKKKITGSIYSF